MIALRHVISAAIVFYCSVSTAIAAGEPVRVGVIGPLYEGAPAGQQMVNGIQLAVKEINAVGGYLGRQVELVIANDMGKKELSVSETERLIKSNVVAVLGYCNTGAALPAIELLQAKRIPTLIACATGTPLTTKFAGPSSYVFAVTARDDIQAEFTMDDLVTRRGWKRIAVLADDTGFGEGGLKDVRAALAKHKLEPVHVARFAVGTKDFRNELAAARTAGADAIYTFGLAQDLTTIAQSKHALNWAAPMVGSWVLASPAFLSGAKEAANGALMPQTFIAEPSNERRTSFLSAFRKQYNVDQLPFPVTAAQGYDAMYLLMHAIMAERSGKLDGPTIKAHLESDPSTGARALTYRGVITTYDTPFSSKDKNAITKNMLFMGQVRDGRVVFAYPEDARRNLVIQRKR